MLDNLFEEVDKFTGKKKSFVRGAHLGSNFLESFNRLPNKEERWVLPGSSVDWHLILAGLAVLTAFLVFSARVTAIQLINREQYLSLAEDNRLRRLTVLPERGVIYSSDGQAIAQNKPAFGIQLNTQLCSKDLKDLTKCFGIVEKINSLLNKKIDISKVSSEINARKPVILLVSGLSKDDIVPVEPQIRQMPGVIVSVQPIRDYVYPDQFAHVLGYIGLDEISSEPKFVGKTGIEEYYEESLSGIPGIQVVQINSTGEIFKVVSQQNALPGKNVRTYLNSKLQLEAFALLKAKVESVPANSTQTFKPEAGVVVAQDPDTGGILALVSYPSYDPNALVRGISAKDFNAMMNDSRYPFFNRAIGAAYPPGSTFKMVMAGAGLEEGNITKDTIVNDPGYIQVGGSTFRNWNTSGHGDVNLVRALQVSNDTYFYTLGGGYGGIKGLGIENMHKWASKFGFGKVLGIDISGEIPGFMPDGSHRDWYLGDDFITAIGQGDVLATPLQVNNVTTYFANGGFLMTPRVVKGLDGTSEYESVVLEQNIISKENFEVIREGMQKAVLPGGTAYPLFDFSQKHNGVKLAGKTGTSEYIDPTGKPRTHAWFTVYGPTEDASISLTVFLEGGGGGSDDAAPIARKLLDLWFSENGNSAN